MDEHTMEMPDCYSLYDSNLKITEEEIARIGRLRKIGYFIALPLAVVGVATLFFPNLFVATSITLDNLVKVSTMLVGSIYFASINLFNKADMLKLKKDRSALTTICEDYKKFPGMPEPMQQKKQEECNELLNELKKKQL